MAVPWPLRRGCADAQRRRRMDEAREGGRRDSWRAGCDTLAPCARPHGTNGEREVFLGTRNALQPRPCAQRTRGHAGSHSRACRDKNDRERERSPLCCASAASTAAGGGSRTEGQVEEDVLVHWEEHVLVERAPDVVPLELNGDADRLLVSDRHGELARGPGARRSGRRDETRLEPLAVGAAARREAALSVNSLWMARRPSPAWRKDWA